MYMTGAVLATFNTFAKNSFTPKKTSKNVHKLNMVAICNSMQSEGCKFFPNTTGPRTNANKTLFSHEKLNERENKGSNASHVGNVNN